MQRLIEKGGDRKASFFVRCALLPLRKRNRPNVTWQRGGNLRHCRGYLACENSSGNYGPNEKGGLDV